MDVVYNEAFGQLEISGDSASTLFAATAKMNGSDVYEFEDEAGKGYAFVAGKLTYLFQKVAGVQRLTIMGG